MRPQDVVVLLKIISYQGKHWYNKTIASELNLSPAEISLSLERSAHSGLINTEKKLVKKQALFEFIKYGLRYVFPQLPGDISRGMLTGISHPYIRDKFISDRNYVWPHPYGEDKGLSVLPLYPGAVDAARKDAQLYLMLTLIDILRIGRTRERNFAITELEKMINNEPSLKSIKS